MRYLFLVVTCICMTFTVAQNNAVDFISAEANITFQPDSALVYGTVKYQFKVLKPVDSIRIDAKNMEILSFYDAHHELEMTYDNKQIAYKLDAGSEAIQEINIHYKTTPKKALYFLKRNNDWNIWTQGQGQYTSNWLPSFDDVNEKVIFNLSVNFDKDYTVLANGALAEKTETDTTMTWHYKMQQPMSSYLVALAISKYSKTKIASASKIPIELYHYTDDSLKAEPTYRYSKQIFDVLEKEIGVPYPWQNYKQVPVHDFLYGGMENTGLTIFSDNFYVDDIGYNDKNYVNINAHELAHHWFGNLVTAKSGEHHWLQEGFATYFALIAERDIFGEDYFYFKLFESAQDLNQQDIAGNGTSLLNPKSSSLTFYQRGAWVLHMLRQKVGDTVFKTSVKNYLNTYKFSSAATDNFIDELEGLYGQALTEFVKTWILQRQFPFDEAMNWLKDNSSYIQEYLIADCEVKTSKCEDYLKYGISDDAKVKVIAQAPELVTADTFKSSLKVRQAISKYVTRIPPNLKTQYESLLKDKSYVTIENAMYNLWLNFQYDGAKYLAKTKHIKGSNDKSLRLLWLVLHLNTPEYQTSKKRQTLEELIDYTDAKYNSETRLKAFHYLNLIKECKTTCKANLENAKSHHNWRMRKYAKNLSKELEQNQE